MSKKVRRALGVIGGAVLGVVLAPVIGVATAIGAVGGAILGSMAVDTIQAIISPQPFDSPAAVTADAQLAQNQGVTINKQGADINIPVVYGVRKLGGARVFVSSGGTRNSDLYVVLAICEGEIAGYEKIYIDDTLVYDSGITTHGQIVNALPGKYANLAQFQVFHGTANQTVSSLVSGVGGWDSSCKLSGIAYIACKFTYPTVTDQASQDANPWSSGIPNVTVQVRGRKIADAATFSPLVSRATAYSAETEVYNNNPINVLLDYLRNPIYGKGLTNDQINFLSFYQASQKWDVSATGSLITNTALLHRFNGIIFTDRTVMDNVKTILSSMRSSLPFSQGRFKLVVEDNGSTNSIYFATSSPVMTFNHDNIIGSLSIESESTASKYNRVIATYMGGQIASNTPTYEPVELVYPTVGSAEETLYLGDDNGRLNELRITLEYITNPNIAASLAQIVLLKSRTRGKVLGFIADSSAAKLDVGDIITVQYGYSTDNYPGPSFTIVNPSGIVIDGTFRVTNILINSDYTFSITAIEHDDNTYGRQPVLQPSPYTVLRADTGSGVVADIYRPSSAGIPTPVFSIDHQYTSPVNGYNTAGIRFRQNVILDGSVSRVEIYIRERGESNFTYLREENFTVNGYDNGIPYSYFAIQGLRFSTEYTVRLRNYNYLGSESVVADLTFTTVAGTSGDAPYSAITTFVG